MFYAFNSAIISGTRISIPKDTESAIERLQRLPHKHQSDIKQVLKAFEDQLWVDPSRIDPQELKLFHALMSLLAEGVSNFDDITKIAILHHHVIPVVPEEFTKFEMLTNAGRFKHELSQYEFDLVLHGHKHWPGVHFQAWADGRQPQVIVSGGTIGGYEGPGAEPGFHWLQIDSISKKLTAAFVPVRQVGHPGTRVTSAISRAKSFELGKRRASLEEDYRIGFSGITAETLRSLLGYLRQGEHRSGQIARGWSHALDENRVSILATAYGLLILDLIGVRDAHTSIAAQGAIQTLHAMKNSDGGWSASSQTAISRPEVSAIVLLALSKWQRFSELHDGIACLDALLQHQSDPLLCNNTFVLAKLCQILADLDPTSSFLDLADQRLKAGGFLDDQGRLAWWAPQLFPVALPSGIASSLHKSTLHTAHAMLALSRLHRSTGGRLGCPESELIGVREWMLHSVDWNLTVDEISRPINESDRFDKLVFRHFTSAWAVTALIAAGTEARQERMWVEVLNLATAHDGGLWNWGGVKRPIWATYDALLALKAAAMAR